MSETNLTRDEVQERAEGEAESLAELVDELGDEWEALDNWALEVTTMRADEDTARGRVEILTGCGGPTTCWTADIRGDEIYRLEYDHSWWNGAPIEAWQGCFDSVRASVTSVWEVGR